MFEFVSYCTSLIVKQMDGTLMHMRLLDFNLSEDLKNITYIGSFERNGKEVF